ncbi:MAG: hypothetical protein QXE90_01905 [Candidatus Micrarchaeia archaeon]
MGRISTDEGKKIIDGVKSDVQQMIDIGLIPSVGYLKGGKSVEAENAKKAMLLIESFEKGFYEKIQRGMVFKEDLPKIEKHLKQAVEYMANGDLKNAQKEITDANKLCMKMRI